MTGEVFGLDLSITSAGLAPAEDFTETVGGGARLGDGRLLIIRNRVRHWLRRRTYRLAVLEAPGSRTSQMFSVIMVHGAVRTELIAGGVPFVLVYPSTLHAFATESGDATKAEMIQMAEKLSGRRFTDDNQADAWLLRRMGTAALGDHSGLTLAQVQRLGVVTSWPDFVDPAMGTEVTGGAGSLCRHKTGAFRNGETWLHAFTLTVCDKPPK